MSDAHRTAVEELAIPHRAKQAFWRLMAAGRAALPAVREGLHHEHADVRQYCCRYLDHFVEREAFAELIAMLDDGDPAVRVQAIHALACDRCKTDTCPPDEAELLPRAIALLRSDPDPHVRNHAIGAIGRSVHTNPTAVPALLDAMMSDPHPSVRKKAAWYMPGGPIFRRTAPKPSRKKRSASREPA